MDGQRRGGWEVCYDTAYFIRAAVSEELRKFGRLGVGIAALLKQEAKNDHDHHRVSGYSDGQGGPPAVKSRSKRG